MNERVNSDLLREKALGIVEMLDEVSNEHQRKYPAEIQSVLVFSGPGTYYDKLKPGQSDSLRWMDRDRIRAGVAVVREVTASKIREKGIDPNKKGHYVTPAEIAEFGPYLIYNGIPIENEIFRLALESEYAKVPPEKTIIIDEVEEIDLTRHPIRHTGDQFKSLGQALINPQSPIYGNSEIALVAHIPDFIRHPFYAELLSEDYWIKTGHEINFHAYALKSRPGTRETHIEAELQRLVPYANKGDLAAVPVKLII